MALDVDGKEVLEVCVNCQFYEDDSDDNYHQNFSCTKDGCDFGDSPFETPQDCFELHFVHSVNWSSQ